MSINNWRGMMKVYKCPIYKKGNIWVTMPDLFEVCQVGLTYSEKSVHVICLNNQIKAGEII